MKRTLTLIVLLLFLTIGAAAQSATSDHPAEQSIQPAQTFDDATKPSQPAQAVKLPQGTLIDVEVAYTVHSIDVKPGERISFRVLVPVVIDGVTVIEEKALVTARVTQAKRGGHWGKAGKLAWSMEDVIAVDKSRVPLAPESAWRSDKLWSLENKSSETKMGDGHITGTSHSGEVAAVSIATGVLFPPLALMGGFKRGENAVLREGRRFVVTVARDTPVTVVAKTATP